MNNKKGILGIIIFLTGLALILGVLLNTTNLALAPHEYEEIKIPDNQTVSETLEIIENREKDNLVQDDRTIPISAPSC